MRSTTVVLTSLAALAGIAFGSLIALLVVGHAFYSRLPAIPAASAGINRYQIVALPYQAFRIDTQTGKVWVYDQESFKVLTLEYVHAHGLTSVTQEAIDKFLRDGYAFALPEHWEEVPEVEAVQGQVQLRPMPERKR